MKPFHYNQDPLYAAAASILTGQQQLTEEVVAFKNEGFKLVNGLMSDEDIHDAVNSTIKSVSQKLGDSTWDVVTDIYGKRENGEWGNDWILQRKGGGAWLTIKDGGPFKAHDSISSVLSFFKIEEEMEDEEMEEAKGDEFAPLIGKKVHHGSPGYPTPEVIASITPHQTQSGKFEIEFESGTFDVLSMDDLDELMNGAEVHFKSPHGGMTVIELKEDEEMEEAKDDLKSLSLDQLKSQLASLDNQIGRLEDKQGFAPEELKAEFRAIDAEIQLRKGMKEGDEGFYSQKMIKNQLQTIVRNSNTCLEMIDAGREFPEWAQSEIAVAEDGIVSVTEFMQSHNSDKKEIDENKKIEKEKSTEEKNLQKIFHKTIDKADKKLESILFKKDRMVGYNSDTDRKALLDIWAEVDKARLNYWKFIAKKLISLGVKQNDLSDYLKNALAGKVEKYADALYSVFGSDERTNAQVLNATSNVNEGVEEINESPSPFKMGTATITAPGHKLDGKQANIFHKYDDGRINVQYPKSDKKGDVLNITLTKGQYKLDDEVMSEEYTIKTDAARAAMEKFTMLDAVELEDFLKAASMYFAEEGEGESEGAFTNLAELFGKAAKAWSNRKKGRRLTRASDFDFSTGTWRMPSRLRNHKGN